MSVTPTDDVLLVALDFEGFSHYMIVLVIQPLNPVCKGVHSIERSTQEDTLLVLFNTAISNLVFDS